ncbi:primosomal replication protein N [Roseateles asaccharophilus]
MALDASLKAESEVIEAGRPRKISLEIKAVAVGEVAKQLQALGIGGLAVFRGFLTHQRNGRGFVAHVTLIEPVAAEPGNF